MLQMGFSFKEMALEFLEGYCFEKHLKKRGGGILRSLQNKSDWVLG